MTPDKGLVILHHGTTLRRALLIEERGPDPNYREQGGRGQPPAEGFSTCIAGIVECLTGIPSEMAQLKAGNFPNEGGPAILEVSVPMWIMDILYADEIGAAIAAGGEARFEPESGLSGLRSEWPNLTKRVFPL